MDAPIIVESVRNPFDKEINNFKEINNKNDRTGFPFDNTDFGERGDRDKSFRTHIDDIVKRHPELAEHLNFENKFNDFPFTSDTWAHKRRGSSDRDSASSSFARPFGSRFKERFGFPFSSSFESEPEYYSQPKKQDQSRSEEKAQDYAQQFEQPQQQQKPPQVPETNASRNPNIQQSNTVDLGQKQDPVLDSRSQRSMSAPPENRAGQQRYVSSINIPMFGQSDDQTCQNSPAQQTPQQQQGSTAQGKSNERVIPIHVEGRDSPVVPKNDKTTFSHQQPSQPQRTFQRPFGQWNRNDTPYFTGDAHLYAGDPSQRIRREDPFANHGQFKTQQQAPQQQAPQQQAPQQATPQQDEREASPLPPPQKVGPLGQIQYIQKAVLELMTQVERFNGKPKDKQYIYLDEMLTRNLLKLDDVDTEGKDDIRQARKEAINCIQRCINILEAKAAANEQLRSQLLQVEKLENPNTVLQVSDVANSGTELVPNEQSVDSGMDVDDTKREENVAQDRSENEDKIMEMQCDSSCQNKYDATEETATKEVSEKESA